MRKLLCPQCKIAGLYVKNEKKERLLVYVSDEGEDGTTLPGRTPEVNIFVPCPKEDNIFCAIRLRHMSLLLTNKIFIAIPIFKFNNYFHSSLLT